MAISSALERLEVNTGGNIHFKQETCQEIILKPWQSLKIVFIVFGLSETVHQFYANTV